MLGENRSFCLALLLAVTLLFSVMCPDLYARARTIRVAAAADLQFAMSELAAQFEKQTGTKVNVTYGSSGNFFSQIENGAPFDLFFSADLDYPEKLQAAGLADAHTLYRYAMGRIVIWAPPGTALDLAKQGWSALLDPSVQKIAIANPEHAPYGRAAVAALRSAGIYDQVKAKLVYGENISQAAQFIQSGNAQAGIVGMSLALSPGMKGGKSWTVPEHMHPPIEQGAVMLNAAKDKDAAQAFLDYVQSASGQLVLAKFGFTVPRARKL